MKSRHNSPQPEPVIHRWRVDTTNTPPKLEFQRMPSITMSGFNPLPTPVSSPSLFQTTGLDDSLTNTNSPPHGQASSPPPSASPRGENTNPHLRPSHSWLSPPSDNEQESRSSSPDPRGTTTTTANNTDEWFPGVGRATLGKSGRVIERLMAENDRLRRELKAELLAREELQKRLDTSKPITDALQVENSNLVAMRASDQSVLGRRERKIEELKTDLEAERTRRETAERRANEMVRLREEGAALAEREVAEAAERARFAMVQAEILEGSHKQLKMEYKQRTETLAKGIREASVAREEDKGKLQRLDVVVDQLRQELERSTKMNGEMKSMVEEYGRESERKVKELGEGVAEKDEECKRLGVEMIEVMEKMKWVMGVKDNVAIAP